MTILVLAVVLLIHAVIGLATFIGITMGQHNMQVFMNTLKVVTPLNLVMAIVDIVVVVMFFLGI